jgi:hypothetical protein
MSHLLVILISFLIQDIRIVNTIELESAGPQTGIRSFQFCNEHIYTLDQYQELISKYDMNGSLIIHKTAKGRGPGEFQNNPNNITCLQNGNILVTETNRFHYFDKDLNHLETKLFDPTQTSDTWGIVSIMEEFKDAYLGTFSISSFRAFRQYVLINKDDLRVEKTFGFEPTTTNNLLERSGSTYHNGKIVTIFPLTGQIIIYNMDAENYMSFNVQDKVSIEELAKNLPERVVPGDSRFIEFLEEGRIIHNYGILNNHLFIVRDRFSENPRSQIDFYTFDGKLVTSHKNQKGYSPLIVRNNQLYTKDNEGLIIYELVME